MASFTLVSLVPKLHHVASSPLRAGGSMTPRVCFTTGTRPLATVVTNATREVQDKGANLRNNAAEAMKQGTKEAKRTAEDVKDKAASTIDQVSQKTAEVASKVTEAAKDLGEKTKQTAQDAWETAKETSQKIKDTVVNKAGDAAEATKREAAEVKRAMNTKN